MERIALNAMKPGALINVAGDLDTLDIFTSAEMIGEGSGLRIGRDLNWLNVRGDLKLGDSGSVIVGRDLGRFPQPVKGTGVGGQGVLVQGNFLIDPTSFFLIRRDLAGPLIVLGDLVGTDNIIIEGTSRDR